MVGQVKGKVADWVGKTIILIEEARGGQ